MMRLMRGNIVERDVPGVERAIPRERNFFPFCKGADDFHVLGGHGLAVRQAPAENLGEALAASPRIIL